MSTQGSSPPAQPPMMSPDGKWVWDGQKWIPVAVHESVFPAYTAAAAAAATAEAPFAETMVSPPINPFAGSGTPSPFATPPQGTPFAGPPPASAFPPMAAPPPAVVSPPIIQPASYTAGGAAPPWEAWAGKGGSDRSRTMKLGAAFIAVALGVVLAIYFGLSQLPFLRASNEQPTPSPSPVSSPTPELAVRSDSAVAQRYITSVIDPSINSLIKPSVQVRQACIGVLSSSCQDALASMAAAMKTVVPAFQQTPPTCIAAQVAKVKADLTAMENGVTLAQKAYADNDTSELKRGLGGYNGGNGALVKDVGNVSTAQKLCDGQPSGP